MRAGLGLGGRDRGFALLIVLWTLVLLAVILTALLASGRSSVTLAGRVRDAAIGRAAADGAIAEAIFHLATGSGWRPDGAPHLVRIGAFTVVVEARMLRDRINPNLASTALLSGLFEAAGLAAQQARRLAEAVVFWRAPDTDKAAAARQLAAYRRAGLGFAPPGRPFASIVELGAVMGMTPALLQRLRPALSLDQPGDPDPAAAPPLVRAALRLSGEAGAQAGAFEGAFPVVAITATAAGPGHTVIRRQALVRMISLRARTPYEILRQTDAPAQ